MFEDLEVYKITWYSNKDLEHCKQQQDLEVYKITWYSNSLSHAISMQVIQKYIKLHGTQNEFNKDMDKYFNTATKEKVIVKIEENKSVVIMPEKIKRQLKRQ